MSLAEIRLDDKYRLATGHLYLTGTQALTRLPMLQHQRDQARGLNTGGFISGYRGSPLGGLDKSLWEARDYLKQHAIHFQPGVNEELAATAVWGSQQTNLFPGAKYDGVFAMWYGKGPGVDRTGDVFKHGNLAGTSPHGGVLVLFGDDPMAKSSTVAHQSEPALIAASIPVFNPASIQEYVDYGLAAFALSRYAGVWVGMKCITDIVEGSASIEVDPARAVFRTPEDFALPPEGVHIRQPDWALDQERRLVRVRLPAVQAFLRANGFDRVTHDVPRRRLGIVASGKSWADLMGAFDQLGLDETTRAALGISVYKPAVVWPLEPEGARAFATGQEELLVIEEKRGLIEEQLARILYDGDARPRLVGKTDELGAPLVAADGELSVREVGRSLVARLCRRARPAAAGRVRPQGQRGGLSRRSGRQRHRDLCRPRARRPGTRGEWLDQDDDCTSGPRRPCRRIARGRRRLGWRARRDRRRPCASACRRHRRGRSLVERRGRARHHGPLREPGRFPVERWLPPPYRQQYLAQPGFRPAGQGPGRIVLCGDGRRKFRRRACAVRPVGQRDQVRAENGVTPIAW